MTLDKGLPIYAGCLAGGALLGALIGHFVAQAIIK